MSYAYVIQQTKQKLVHFSWTSKGYQNIKNSRRYISPLSQLPFICNKMKKTSNSESCKGSSSTKNTTNERNIFTSSREYYTTCPNSPQNNAFHHISEKSEEENVYTIPQLRFGSRVKQRNEAIMQSPLPRSWNIFTNKSDYERAVKYRILSYNILADSLVDFSYIPYCTTKEVEWGHRGPLLLEQLLSMNSDLICLQEDDHFEDFFQPQLATLGYEGLHKSRTGIKEEGKEQTDGCSIFFRSDSFELIEAVEVNYDIQMPHLDRGNIALITVLKRIASSSSSTFENTVFPDTKKQKLINSEDEYLQERDIKMEDSSDILILANTHILYNPKRGDTKLAQVNYLCNHLSLLQGKYPAAAIVICGDFNSTPVSAMYEYITNGELNTKDLDRTEISGQFVIDERENSTQYCDVSSDGTSLPAIRHLGHGTTSGRFVTYTAVEKDNRERQTRHGKMPSPTRKGNLSNQYRARSPRSQSSSPNSVQEFDTFSSSRDLKPSSLLSSTKLQAQEESIPEIPRQIWDFPGNFVNFMDTTISHDLGKMKSMYAQTPNHETTGEPAYSNFHYFFKGTVDYVFFTPEKIRSLAVLEMPHRFHLLGKIGLPCEANPSDHLPLVADFEFCNSSNFTSDRGTDSNQTCTRNIPPDENTHG